jgi:hypothetical protein
VESIPVNRRRAGDDAVVRLSAVSLTDPMPAASHVDDAICANAAAGRMKTTIDTRIGVRMAGILAPPSVRS